MPKARAERRVKIDAMRAFMKRLLMAAGCDEEGASISSDAFLEADLRGIGLQGLDHMPSLIRHLRTGRTDPRARPRIVSESVATALVDGGRGLGQRNGVFATDLAIRKAREAGCAAVAVINSGDIFMVGYYAERIGRADLVGLVFSDAPPLVHPFGGTERMLGTNPLAIAVPTDGGDPLVHDMATSALSASRIRQAAYHDEDVAPGMGVDREGRPTVRAAAIREGAIAPLAGPKGFGLAICVALLSGPLVGAFCGPTLNPWMSEEPGGGPARGQLFVAIDPAAFGDPAVFRRRAGDYIREIRSSRKARGVDRIRVPGERAFETRRAQLASGHVAVGEAVWQRALRMAAEAGVDVPAAE